MKAEDINKNKRIYPVEQAHALDSRLRRILQNPKRIISTHILPGMNTVDYGCGSGFFTFSMAEAAGPEGKVTAVDIQQEMLDRVAEKAKESPVGNRIRYWNRLPDPKETPGNMDFVLLFWAFHEVPDRAGLVSRLRFWLKPGGRCLFAEPRFHVSKKDFFLSLSMFEKNGFSIQESPKIFFSRSVLLEKTNPGTIGE